MATTGTGRLHRASGLQFEFYQAPLRSPEPPSVDDLPYRETPRGLVAPALVVASDQGLVWARFEQGHLRTVDGPAGATFGVRPVSRGFSTWLALVARDGQLLVNGEPALRFSIIRPRDCLFLVEAGTLLYVTQRFRPFVGVPTEETGLLGQECPACSITIEADPPTHVVTCPCGAVFHHETEETHPHLPPHERLNCLPRAKRCLRCRQPLSTQERLLWDPASL